MSRPGGSSPFPTQDTWLDEGFHAKWSDDHDAPLLVAMRKGPLFQRLALALYARLRALAPWLGKLPPGSLVLDYGCGSGKYSVFLQKVFGLQVVGADLSLAATSQAARLAAREGLRARFVAGDGLDLPFRDASFDAVFSIDVVEHLPEPDRAFRELHRVVRPGGEAILFVQTDGYRNNRATWQNYVIDRIGVDPWVELDGHVSLRSAPAVLSMAREAGFAVESVKYEVGSHLLFNFLLPRPEPFLYARYPALRRYTLVRLTEWARRAHDLLGRVLPLRVAVHLLGAAAADLLSARAGADCGGVYLRLGKVRG